MKTDFFLTKKKGGGEPKYDRPLLTDLVKFKDWHHMKPQPQMNKLNLKTSHFKTESIFLL